MQTRQTMASLIDLTLRWNADSILLRAPGEEWSGLALDDHSARLANALAQMGISAGDVVCLISGNSARYFAAYLALHRLGAVPCALHVRESAQQLSQAIEFVNARLVIADQENAEKMQSATEAAGLPLLWLDGPPSPERISYDLLLTRGDASRPSLPDLSDESPAAILLSSGSTGKPKAVLHTQRSLVAIALHARALFGDFGPTTRSLQMVGTSFAAWPFTTLPVFVAGGTVTMRDRFEPESFCKAIQDDKVSFVATVPAMIRLLSPDVTDKYDLTSLRIVSCAGEPPSLADLERIASWSPGVDIRCPYLASESGTSAGTLCRYSDIVERGKVGSAGKPIPGADLRIVDPAGDIDALVPQGTAGEILLFGPSIAAGYLNDETKTRDKFVGDWWRSGDLGLLDEDGFLFIQGRADNMINTGGIKVFGEEVELALLQHPAIQQAAVIGVADEKWGNRIVAHLVATQEVEITAIEQFCLEGGLARFKLPKQFHFHDALPLGPTGKLDRVALRKVTQ